MKNREKIYQITAILLLVDQFIKYLVTHKMNLYDSFSIIPGFFKLFYVRNSGAAFSILARYCFVSSTEESFLCFKSSAYSCIVLILTAPHSTILGTT